MNLKPQDTTKRNKILTFILAIVDLATFFFIFFMYKYDNIFLFVLEFIGLFILSFIISTTFHELGHLLFGLALGYKFVYFQSLFLSISKREGKFKFRIGLSKLFGQCLLSFDKDIDDMNFSYYLYGGSIFNLSLFIASFLHFILGYALYDNFHIFSLILALINFSLYLNNGIALNSGGIYNDTLNIKLMRESKAYRYAIFNQLKIEESIHNSKLINEFDEDLLNNQSYSIPYNIPNGFILILLRTMKKVENKENDPFEEIKCVHNYISYYPKMYRRSIYMLLLYHNLINDIGYKWIISIKENQNITKSKTFSDPILVLNRSLIAFKENALSKDEVIENINKTKKAIDSNTFSKVEKEFYQNLNNLTLEYLLNKELEGKTYENESSN